MCTLGKRKGCEGSGGLQNVKSDSALLKLTLIIWFSIPG